MLKHWAELLRRKRKGVGEVCMCGHVQQDSSRGWMPNGGIHSLTYHWGNCGKCPTCRKR